MATVTVDNAKLVLNAFAANFQNNLVSADLIEWRKFDSEMNDRNALTVVEQVGPRYGVTRTTSAVNDLSAGVQDSVFGSEQFTVKDVFGTSMGWADFVKIRDIGDARESVALKNAAQNLSEAIDSYIIGELMKVPNNWVGTPGNAINDVDDILSAYTRLKDEGVPDEELRAVLTYADKQALGTAVAGVAAFADGMASDTFRKGFTGNIGGIPTIFTQQLQNLTVGTRVASGAAQVDGAAESVNYSAVAVSTAPGRYKTQNLSIKNLTGTKTINKGEVFTIANVNAWDNRAGQTLGRLQQFVVVEDFTSAAGIGELRIFPAIIVQGTSTVNTAHATVDSVPADSAAITFLGTASTAYKPRLVVAKSAGVMSCADLVTPYTDTAMRKSLTRVPLSVRMWKHSDFATGAHSIRFDVATTFNPHMRAMAVKVNGG